MDEGEKNERSEARRKRIVERGSDRLALITGQIASLPPTGPSPKHSYTQSSPASFFTQHHHHHQEYQYTAADPLDQNQYDDQKAGNHVPIATAKQGGFARSTAFNPRNKAESHLQKRETNIERAPIPPPQAAAESKHKTQPPQSEIPKFPKQPPLVEKDVLRKPLSTQLSFFTAKDINSCIISSENIRVCCSVAIALLVVLSNIGLPRDVVRSRSILGSKPLYLVLLSDVTIVAARLLEKLRSEERIRGEAKITAPQQANRDWSDAVRVLEVSLVAYQVIRAIFIDLSCYMVVVISGISLV